MPWAALAGTLTSAASSSGSVSGMNPSNERNQITIAPVGVNLGAIMQPYTDNPYNGGSGLLTQAPRFSGGTLPEVSNSQGMVWPRKMKLDSKAIVPASMIALTLIAGAFLIAR